MRQLAYFYIVIFLLAATACASLQGPRNLSDQLAYSYAALSTARGTAASLLDRGRITITQAESVQKQANEIRANLDLAKVLANSGNTDDAAAKLQFAQSLLTEIEKQLNAAQEKK